MALRGQIPQHKRNPILDEDDDIVISTSPSRRAVVTSPHSSSGEEIIPQELINEGTQQIIIDQAVHRYGEEYDEAVAKVADEAEEVIDLRADYDKKSIPATPARSRYAQSDDDDYVINEAEPLLPQPAVLPQPTVPFKLDLMDQPVTDPMPKSLLQRSWDKVKRAAGFVKDNPIEASLSVFTSLQPAINAFLFPTNSSPKDMSKDWWDNMSDSRKSVSIFFLVCSFMINFVLGLFFLPKARSELKNIFTKFKEHPFIGIFALVIGLYGGLSLGMLGYDAFIAFPLYACAAVGMFSLVINFATRLVSVKNVAERGYNLIAPTHRASVMKNTNEHLSRLRLTKKQRDDITTELSYAAKRIHHDTLHPATIRIFHEELLKSLVNELTQLEKHPAVSRLFYKKRYCSAQNIQQGAYTTASMTLALSGAAIGFCIFTDKGFAGLKTLESFFGTDHLNQLPVAWKILIGSGSGIASAMLYFNSIIDLRMALAEGLGQLAQHPAEIPLAIGLLGACIASAFSMYNVAGNFVANPNNLFSSLTQQAPMLFKLGGALGGLGVNTKATALQIFGRETDRYEPKIDDVLNYAALNDLFPMADKPLDAHTDDETRKRIQRDTVAIKTLSELSLFLPKPMSQSTIKNDAAPSLVIQV